MARAAHGGVVPALCLVALNIISSVASGSCVEIEPLVLLPADEVCAGWVRDGEAQTAYTIEEFTDIIDGGAFLYEEYGFVAAAFQDYAGEVAGEPVSMTLSVFNQRTAENGEALYYDPDSGSGDPVGDWGGSGAARRRIAFGIVSFQFWEECFFVSIVVTSGSDAAVPHARGIAEGVTDLILGATQSRSITWGEIKVAFNWPGRESRASAEGE